MNLLTITVIHLTTSNSLSLNRDSHLRKKGSERRTSRCAVSWLCHLDGYAKESCRAYTDAFRQWHHRSTFHCIFIDNQEGLQSYQQELVKKWISEIEALPEFAKTKPQAAYSCFTHGLVYKLNDFLRAIPDFWDKLNLLQAEVVTSDAWKKLHLQKWT